MIKKNKKNINLKFFFNFFKKYSLIVIPHVLF
jgi:hypothetical protein